MYTHTRKYYAMYFSLIPSCAHPVVYTVGPEFPWLRLIIYESMKTKRNISVRNAN